MPTILIPALDPAAGLIDYVQALLTAGAPAVIVVDDGSRPECAQVFAALESLPGCTVLHHPVNRGKGAALKTAICWYLDRGGENGLVTADCDGQHVLEDVLAVSRALETNPDRLILGCRDFGGDTPPRSAAGNAVTSAVMSALYGVKLKDTQTGLRGLPQALLPALAGLEGERYEYELNMLILARRSGVELEVVPIHTLYFAGNAGSRYRPLADSLRIAALLGRGLLQYIGSSALSALVDVALYAVLVKWALADLPAARRLVLAAGLARLVSSLVNYNCNRRLPYVQNTRVLPTAARYYTLWAGQLLASIGLTWAVCAAGMDDLAGKLLVDGLLAVASYQIQMRWVFRGAPGGACPAAALRKDTP